MGADQAQREQSAARRHRGSRWIDLQARLPRDSLPPRRSRAARARSRRSRARRPPRALPSRPRPCGGAALRALLVDRGRDRADPAEHRGRAPPRATEGALSEAVDLEPDADQLALVAELRRALAANVTRDALA